MANSSLHDAKNAKNDEFYTRLEDINKEMSHYEDKFRGKVVFCNCNDAKRSDFWKYFHLNFEYLGLKKLITTHYESGEVQSYKIEYTGGNDENFEEGTITPLEQNGDFRSDECIALLDEADIVVTNPPFSLFREYVAMLIEHNKKFIIIGNKNAVKYKEFFPYLKNGKIWIGYESPSEFNTPTGVTKRVKGLCRWFTNLDIAKRHDMLETTYLYSQKDSLYPDLYTTFDELKDVINVNRVDEIPMDYDGIMAVPITFIDKYNPEQFEILDMLNRYTVLDHFGVNTDVQSRHSHCCNINGNPTFSRVVIRKKAGANNG